MVDTQPDVASLEDSLRQCRLEHAALREEQETWAEHIAPLEEAEKRFEALTVALDERLAATDRATPGLRGWLKRRILPESPTPSEVAGLAKIRSSPLFDGAWYLRHYPDVAATGLSPALHYLRHGGPQRRDPGPNFDARGYAQAHPELPRRGNPLLHYQASVPGIAR